VKSGDAFPIGADAVVRIEHAELTADVVAIIDPVAAGNEVELAGCNCQRGGRLLVARRQLCPGDVGALASAGFACVRVTRHGDYTRLARIATQRGARTSLFIPTLDRFVVAVRATGDSAAEL
jgi:hypothetical protein